MFVRLILALFVMVVVIMVIRHLRGLFSDRARPPVIEAKTVQCAHCQLYIPRQDAVQAHGRLYCSSEHAERDEA